MSAIDRAWERHWSALDEGRATSELVAGILDPRELVCACGRQATCFQVVQQADRKRLRPKCDDCAHEEVTT